MRVTKLAFLATAIAGIAMAGAAAAQPATAGDWTGLHVGAELGGRWDQTHWNTTSIEMPNVPLRTGNPAGTNLDSSTFHGAVFAGYDWQVDPNWVLGIEGDVGYGDAKSTHSPIPATVVPGGCGISNCSLDHVSARQNWDGSVRARVGYVVTPGWLVYATGGIAWQEQELHADCAATGPWCVANRTESNDETRTGWTLGAGVETKFTHNWVGRAEYRYADFGDRSHSFFASAPIDTVGMRSSLQTNTFELGLGYQF